MESKFIYAFKFVTKSVASLNLLEVGQNIFFSIRLNKQQNPKKQFFSFMSRHHFPNLHISNLAEVIVSSDIRPSKNSTFYDV